MLQMEESEFIQQLLSLKMHPTLLYKSGIGDALNCVSILNNASIL